MSRLSEELLGHYKVFASQVIRLCVTLPKQRQEVRVLGKQLLRSVPLSLADPRRSKRKADIRSQPQRLGLTPSADRFYPSRPSPSFFNLQPVLRTAQ